MTTVEKSRWKNWADILRQDMMSNLTSSVTKSVDEIAEETSTEKPEKIIQSERFWRSCQQGKSPNDHLTRAGFEIEFEADDKKIVRDITLTLNKTWLDIQERVIARKNS